MLRVGEFLDLKFIAIILLLMSVHMPNENYITFSAEANMSKIITQEFLHKTMLTEWFVANKKYPDAKDLTYCDFPSKWCWDEQTKTWKKRHRDGGKIGRIYFVHPSVGERYYLRMLLLIVKGAESYEDLRTYNNITYTTFREACNARGLNNDKEWYNAFDEAAHWVTSNELRQLFVTMLLFCEVGDEYILFEKGWKLLSDDIQYNMHKVLHHPSYQMNDSDLKDHLLDTLGTLFSKRGSNINEFNLPKKSATTSTLSTNSLVNEELCYDASILLIESENLVSQMNSEQHYAFSCIINTVLANKLGFLLSLVMEAQEKLFYRTQ
jgi:hypothetical protein